MSDTPKKVSQLSPEQRDWLLRRAREGRPPDCTGIQPRRNRSAPAPLSFAQQRLWFFEQLRPGTSAYNVPVAVRITGPLDGRLMKATLTALVRRHEALRTTIREVRGEVVQVVEPGVRAVLEQVELSHIPAARAERTSLGLCIEASRRSFDLSQGPLLRMTLLHLAAESHILLLVFHHIISDLWSLGVLMRELTLIYSALQSSRAPVLPELPIQYADYAIWQREKLQGDLLEREIAHWRRELAAVPAVLELPADHPRPPVMGYHGARLSIGQLADRTRTLKELAQRCEVTLFMALLAAYSVLLARFSGQAVLAVGSPVAARPRIELKGLIGFFINMLVLRADLRWNPSFRTLLGRMKETCVQALNHQDLPFEHLVDDLRLERDLSRPPLIQAAMALQNVALPSLVLADLRFEVMDIDIGITKFDLSLELFERDDALNGWLEYNTEVFEASTAERIARCFSVLVESLEDGLEQSVWELPLLDESERRQVLSTATGRQAQARPLLNLPARIAAMARRSPEVPAVVGRGEEVLSYGELVDRAGRVAGALRDLRFGPEALAAVLVERSPDLLVGMLGILGAGGACLLLDPGRERSWLERMLERSGCAIVLTRGSLVGSLPEHGAAEVLLERLESRAAGVEDWEGADPESLAFVVQPSGSHRRPHLVELPHRSVAAWAEALQELLEPRDLAAVAGEGAPETVDGIFDLMIPLGLGGCVVLQKGASISLWSATPARLAAGLRAGELTGVRAVRSCGEGIGESLRTRLLAAGVERVYDSFSSALGGVRPTPEMAAYVLGQLDIPVPIGVPGELWLAGEGLARGYRGHAEKTAQRFVPDPFAGIFGARRVRTGDLARWRADGRLELLGSLERQVEVRGARLRLSSVEELLAEHHGVLRAVASLQENGASQRLVAHALSVGPDGPAPEKLREFLRARLPERQIPWGLAVVEELPLTPTGRPDEVRLPRVETREERAGIAPRTEVERLLVEIWCELLGVETVSIHDNFFQLGGNSLLATRVVARINQVFQLSLVVETLFKSPTIADLALATDEHLLVQLGEADFGS
jgi:non-ribosomal peptide synthetase component F